MGLGILYLICSRTRRDRKNVNLFDRTMYLPKLGIGILKNLFVVYFFIDKYSTTLKDFLVSPFSEITSQISSYKITYQNME